uniref:RNA helicase n=1 Tax=Hirondellea gigas TaxID=1518452 RepID=A0A6A7G6A0_9CRUS
MEFTMTISDTEENTQASETESEKEVFQGGFSFEIDSDEQSNTFAVSSSRLEDFRSSNFQTSIDEKIRKLREFKKKRENLFETDDKPEEQTSDVKSTSDSSQTTKKRDQMSQMENSAKKKRKIEIPNTCGNPDNIQFNELKLSRPLLKALHEMNFLIPTSIQASAIPSALAGSDILGNAVTGSGKTAAFMLPILERLLHRPKQTRRTRVLILTPTRELAAQCFSMGKDLAKYSDIEICFIVGGLAMKPQEVDLRNRPDIVIATSGRLIDHLRNSQSIHLEDIEILVLDEADRLLEESFTDEIFEIIRMCPRGRQTMLFSATLTSEVNQLAKLSLNNPKRISVDDVYDLSTGLQQEFVRIRDKNESDQLREAIILSLCLNSFHSRTIVFLKSKVIAHRLMILFGLADLSAAELHGNLTQTQRLNSLDSFKLGRVNFLLCTDLASRGLDISGVETVISSHLPNQIRTYVHRVGRTARAGKSGRSVTLVGEKERKTLKTMLKKSKDSVRSRKISPSNIEKCQEMIKNFKDDVQDILYQEMAEKRVRIAEMEANKLQNVIQFQDEILNRPPKTWFQNEKQRKESKQKGIELSSPAEFASKLKSSKKRKSDKESKKDPFRGLSRKKRRRKMIMMDEQKERAVQEKMKSETVKASPSKLTSEQHQRKVARQAKRTVNPQKIATSTSKTSKKRHPARKFASSDEKTDRFAAQIADFGFREEKKSTRKFQKKTKKRFKRRR